MSGWRDLRERLEGFGRAGVAAVATEIRVNPRARLGLAALALVLVAAISLKLYDFAMVRRADLERLLQEERQLTQLSGPGAAAWLSAQAEADWAVAASEALLWSRGDPGVAQADFYNWVGAAATNAGLTGAEVRIGEQKRLGRSGNIVEIHIGVFASSAKGASVGRDSIYQFLRTLAESRRRIATRSLRVRLMPAIVLEAELVAFVEVVNSAPVSGAALNQPPQVGRPGEPSFPGKT